MPEESELEKKIRELQAENARLKANGGKIVEYSAREDSYKGSPILVFERPTGRPFSLGAAKLTAISKCWHKVEAFLKKHGKADSDDRAIPSAGEDRI